MQLICAAVALLGSTGWWFAARVRVKLVLFALFGLATVAAVRRIIPTDYIATSQAWDRAVAAYLRRRGSADTSCME